MHSCAPYSATISCVCDADNAVLRCVSRLRWARAKGVISTVFFVMDVILSKKYETPAGLEWVRRRETFHSFKNKTNEVYSRVGEVSQGGVPLLTVLQDPGVAAHGAGGSSHNIIHASIFVLLLKTFQNYVSRQNSFSSEFHRKRLLSVFKNTFVTFEYPHWSFRRSFFRIFTKPWMDRMDNRVSGISLCLWNTSEVCWSGHI